MMKKLIKNGPALRREEDASGWGFPEEPPPRGFVLAVLLLGLLGFALQF